MTTENTAGRDIVALDARVVRAPGRPGRAGRRAAQAGGGAVRARDRGNRRPQRHGPDRRDTRPESCLAPVTAGATVGPWAPNGRTRSSSAPGWPGRPRPGP